VQHQGILKGEYHCTVDLQFDGLGISCMATDNFCFCLQNRLIQTSQTGGQWYSDTSPFSIPGQHILTKGLFVLAESHNYVYLYKWDVAKHAIFPVPLPQAF
jgi:hypothetical protein